MLLRDIFEAGDAPHLPANHRARAGAADRHRPKTRAGRSLSVRGPHGGARSRRCTGCGGSGSGNCATFPGRFRARETDALRRVLDRAGAELLHIYFGHIAVHLLPLIRTWPKASVVSFHGADVMVDLDKPAYRGATLAMLEAVRLVLVRSESLRQALIGLGCAAGETAPATHRDSARGSAVSARGRGPTTGRGN